MKREYYNNGLHKILAAQKTENCYSVAWYELMGNRWVKLGNSELYSREMFFELLSELRRR